MRVAGLLLLGLFHRGHIIVLTINCFVKIIRDLSFALNNGGPIIVIRAIQHDFKTSRGKVRRVIISPHETEKVLGIVFSSYPATRGRKIAFGLRVLNNDFHDRY